MEISSKFVGTSLKTHETLVSPRHIMNYAASIGDDNPCYMNDERKDGVVAHPMFCVAVTWPICANIWDYIPLEDFPKEVIFTQVHYTEHLTIHRLIKPGEGLKIKGKIAAILPHRAGTHIVMRFDAFDSVDKPVFTEHVGGLLRGVKCRDDGKGKEDLPEVSVHDDDQLPTWESVIPIDPLAPFIYDAGADIFFPIHTSIKFAHQVGLPGIIYQGTATLACAVRELVNREMDGNPAMLQSIYCRFTGMVLPGTEIKVQVFERDKNGSGLFFAVLNAKGEKAISRGYVKIEV